jgi:hypothetical protein
VEFEGYAPQRRAVRIAVEATELTIDIRPRRRVVHPVFELIDAPAALARVELDGRRLEAARDEYAWDGGTLWLGRDIDGPARLRLEVAAP